MSRCRSTLAAFAAFTLLVVGCSGSGARLSVRSSLAGSTTVGVRGEPLALNAMTYLGSNRVSPVLQVYVGAPAAVVVGSPVDVLVQLHPAESAVWVGMRPQRLAVKALDSRGRIVVATDGCPITGPTSCDPRLLYVPTAFPISDAPTGGVVTDQGFALHVATSTMQPGRYEMTFPIRYPSSLNSSNVLDVTDTLHVRLDVGSHAPPSPDCTVADLHRPLAPMPAPHTITDTVVLFRGDDRLDPPPPGTKPRIPASAAWRYMAPDFSGRGGSASLVLTMLTSTLPAIQLANGTLVEGIHDTLAWVLYIHAGAVDSRLGGPGLVGPGPHGLGSPAPAASAPCEFMDAVSAMNAMTGHGLLDGGGGPYPEDPIRI